MSREEEKYEREGYTDLHLFESIANC
jgi:hypothetical protein